jgi:holliday junction DNA helicase RuvB
MKFFNKLGGLFPLTTKDIFYKIHGHDDIKWIFNKALRADAPVHLLLVGAPGLAKTRFLKAMESKYPDKSYFALASGASGAGMIDLLFKKQPRYLLVDEIEDMKKSDQACLLSLMQDGDLIETKKVNTRSMKLNCSVFATCNDTKRLRPALLTRFKIVEIKPYSREQFIDIAVEHLGSEFSFYIAEGVWDKFGEKSNMREAERIAAMCHSEAEVDEYLRITQ